LKSKLKHNKKRNTAFLYEMLVRELTKSVVKKNEELKNKIMGMIKEHFHRDTLMGKELKLYKQLCETYNMSPHSAEKLIFEIRKQHDGLDKKGLFSEQTTLIKKINQSLSKQSYSSFVPNYKSLATIYQIFNGEATTKERVLLEETMMRTMVSSPEQKKAQNLDTIDNITYKTFVKKFNAEYGSKLLEEQKQLLNKYIVSFLDNGVEFKIHLNEEIGRLKSKIQQSLSSLEIKEDDDMLEKTKTVLKIVESFSTKTINDALLKRVLKIQSLVKEINNGDNS